MSRFRFLTGKAEDNSLAYLTVDDRHGEIRMYNKNGEPISLTYAFRDPMWLQFTVEDIVESNRNTAHKRTAIRNALNEPNRLLTWRDFNPGAEE